MKLLTYFFHCPWCTFCINVQYSLFHQILKDLLHLIFISYEHNSFFILISVFLYFSTYFEILPPLSKFICFMHNSYGGVTTITTKQENWPGFNTLRPRQNGCHFAGDIFKCIFLNENAWISLKISLKFVPKVRINNIPAMVQIMAWRRSGDKPLFEPMMVSLLTHICVTRPQWVKVTRCPIPFPPRWTMECLL